MLIPLLGSLALAAPPPNGSVLLGVGALPDSGDPANARLGARLGVPVVYGEVAGFDIVLPLELATSGDEAFGIRSQNTAVELAPTARLRFLPDSPVRVYGDAGIGFVHRFSKIETWFGDASTSRTVPMLRSGLGLEFGPPGVVSVVVEPIGWRRYDFGENGADMLTFMAGVHFGG